MSARTLMGIVLMFLSLYMKQVEAPIVGPLGDILLIFHALCGSVGIILLLIEACYEYCND